MFNCILKTIFGRNQNMAGGPRDDPVPPLNEAAGPREHPVPKPGVRRSRRSREEEEEEEKEEEVETRAFKRQRTLRFPPWPRPDPVDRISDLLKEKTALISRLLQSENEKTALLQSENEKTALISKLKSKNVAMATKIRDMETKTRDMESDFIMAFQILQSRLVELTQANEKLTKSKKDMVTKIQAMEVELPRSPSRIPLPSDYDSDDSFNNDFYTYTEDSYQAQAEKRKPDESESRSKTQEPKQKRDEPEQSRPDNPNVSILEKKKERKLYVVYDFRKREKHRQKLYGLEGPEFDNPPFFNHNRARFSVALRVVDGGGTFPYSPLPPCGTLVPHRCSLIEG